MMIPRGGLGQAVQSFTDEPSMAAFCLQNPSAEAEYNFNTSLCSDWLVAIPGVCGSGKQWSKVLNSCIPTNYQGSPGCPAGLTLINGQCTNPVNGNTYGPPGTQSPAAAVAPMQSNTVPIMPIVSTPAVPVTLPSATAPSTSAAPPTTSTGTQTQSGVCSLSFFPGEPCIGGIIGQTTALVAAGLVAGLVLLMGAMRRK